MAPNQPLAQHHSNAPQSVLGINSLHTLGVELPRQIHHRTRNIVVVVGVAVVHRWSSETSVQSVRRRGVVLIIQVAKRLGDFSGGGKIVDFTPRKNK